MSYRLQAVYDKLVLIILASVGTFQLLISLWHTTETYFFQSPMSSLLIFLIMLSGLANIMNGFTFSGKKSKTTFTFLTIISVAYVLFIGGYINIVLDEVANNANVEWTATLIRSVVIMITAAVLTVVSNLIALKQLIGGK